MGMRGFRAFVAAQFGCPSGAAGWIVTRVMNAMNRRLYRCVEREVSSQHPDSVLDVGFGNGALVSSLAARTSAGIICGIDISDDMAASARRRCRAAKDRVCLKTGSVMRIPFGDRSFDAVYTVNTHYFWPDAQTGFREIRRVMKDEAVFLLAGYEKQWLESWSYTRSGFRLYTREQISGQLADAGLKLCRTITVRQGKSYCMVVRKSRSEDGPEGQKETQITEQTNG